VIHGGQRPASGAGATRGGSLRSEEPLKGGPMALKVDFDPADPSSVIVWYSKPIENQLRLCYGAGLGPYVNIIDSKDIGRAGLWPCYGLAGEVGASHTMHRSRRLIQTGIGSPCRAGSPPAGGRMPLHPLGGRWREGEDLDRLR
jgi:hypothetical protein